MSELTAADLDRLEALGRATPVKNWPADIGLAVGMTAAEAEYTAALRNVAPALLRLARLGLEAAEMALALDSIADGCPHDHGWQVGQCGCQADAAGEALRKYTALQEVSDA